MSTKYILEQITDAERLTKSGDVIIVCEALRLIVDKLEDLEYQIANIRIILSDSLNQ